MFSLAGLATGSDGDGLASVTVTARGEIQSDPMVSTSTRPAPVASVAVVCAANASVLADSERAGS